MHLFTWRNFQVYPFKARIIFIKWKAWFFNDNLWYCRIYGTYRTSYFPLLCYYTNFFDIKRLLSKTFCHFSSLQELYTSSISQVLKKVIAWWRFIDNFFSFILLAKKKIFPLHRYQKCHLRTSIKYFLVMWSLYNIRFKLWYFCN